jgi:hypothetical protein
MKTCNRCGVEKPAASYYKNQGSKDGTLGICNTCVGVRQKRYVEANAPLIALKMQAYHAANRDKLLAQQKEYKTKNRTVLAQKKRERGTGFSPKLFAATLEYQQGCCAICDVNFNTISRQQQHADHCHTTGTPRGVLCQECNTGLGKFADSPDLLQKAVNYLKHPPVRNILLKGYK